MGKFDIKNNFASFSHITCSQLQGSSLRQIDGTLDNVLLGGRSREFELERTIRSNIDCCSKEEIRFRSRAVVPNQFTSGNIDRLHIDIDIGKRDIGRRFDCTFPIADNIAVKGKIIIHRCTAEHKFASFLKSHDDIVSAEGLVIVARSRQGRTRFNGDTSLIIIVGSRKNDFSSSRNRQVGRIGNAR